jgi:hypothetical protein
VALVALLGGVAFFLTRQEKPPSSPLTQVEGNESSKAEVAEAPPVEPAEQPSPEPSLPGEPEEADDTDDGAADAPGDPRPSAAGIPAGEPNQVSGKPDEGAAPNGNADEGADSDSTPTSGKPAVKTEVEKKPAAKEPASNAPPFDRGAAVSALNAAVNQATSCRQPGDPSGTARVVITFAPSGRVTSANLSGPPFAGTRTGGCIASTMRRARVPQFSGDHVTVSKSVVIR